MAQRRLPRWVQVYVVPAAVMQSVTVGGGYGTGREVMEFISAAGPRGGLLALLWVFAVFAVITVLSFNFARVFQAYDYRHFFRALLGRWWWLFEVLAVVLMTLVLAVVLSAAATMAEDWFGVPPLVTRVAVLAVTVAVLLIGEQLVEALLSGWAALFSLFLGVTLVLVALDGGDGIMTAIGQGHLTQTDSEAFGADPFGSKGAQFALYNIAAIPILLYTLKAIRTVTEAVVSGLLAAAATTLPGLLMHLAFIPHLPTLLHEPLPMPALIESLDMPVMLIGFGVLLIGTIVQTAIGVLQGVIERIDGLRADRGKPALTPLMRGSLAGLVLAGSALASVLGVITLIAQGYGSLAWGFLLVYALPLVTIGVWRMRRQA